MTDFAVLVHFRVLPASQAAANGFLGGYVCVLGRYPSEKDFLTQITQHLDELGYLVVGLDEVVAVTDSSDLNDELAPLHDQLDLYPLQYRNFHMYRNDDA